MKLTHPVNLGSYVITQGYTKGHEAIDYAPKSGQPTEIRAAGDGVVSYVGLTNEFTFQGKKYRNPVIIIKHDQGFITEYHHCDKMFVRPGDVVKAEQVIGLCGNKGAVIASPGGTGVHLHFVLKKNGVAINSVNYLNGEETVLNSAQESELRPWEYRVKIGGTVSHITRELINAGLWSGANDREAWNKFYALNNPTPAGGYKPGTVIKWYEPIKDEPKIEHIEAPLSPEPVDINDVPAEKETINLDTLKEEKPILASPERSVEYENTPMGEPVPEVPVNPTPKEVVEMARNPAFDFDIKDIKVEAWQKDALIEASKPLLAKLGGYWKKVDKNIRKVVLVIVTIVLVNLSLWVTGVKEIIWIVPIINLPITITSTAASTVLSLLMTYTGKLLDSDDQFIVTEYVKS